MLAERRHLWRTLRLWSIVLPSNVIGALIFAMLAVRTGALRPEFVHSMATMGLEAIQPSAHHIFWSGVVGGVDHRLGRLAGERKPLYYWLGPLDLVASLRCRAGRICSLHRNQRRDPRCYPGSPTRRVALSLLALCRHHGEYCRRCALGHALGVWPSGRRRGLRRLVGRVSAVTLRSEASLHNPS